MMNDKIFTTSFYVLCAPMAAAGNTFEINERGRQVRLKSVTIDWQIQDNNAPNMPLNFNTQNTQAAIFQVTSVFSPLGSFFQNFGAAPVDNGGFFAMHRPGQYYFDKLFFNENIFFGFTVGNYDALVNYLYYFHCVAEIEIIKQK